MKPRILVVDDERSMCELLETDLSLREFDVSCYTSAEEGFQGLASNRFDVVLTDLKMPGVDGIEFCRRIVANRSDIPVILSSGHNPREVAEKTEGYDIAGFVAKPYSLNMMRSVLAEVLAGTTS